MRPRPLRYRTPLLSYSVAKSFTNALFGILVHQKRLRIDRATRRVR